LIKRSCLHPKLSMQENKNISNIIMNISINDHQHNNPHNHKISKCISHQYILRGDLERQAITHIWECSVDSNQCTSYKRKLNTHDIYAPADRSRMTTFHNAPTWPKLLRYTQNEVLVPIGIVWPSRHLGLRHSHSLLLALDWRLWFVQVFTKLCRLTGFQIPAYGQYYSILAQQDQFDAVPNRHRHGLSSWSHEYAHTTPQHSHPMILCFPLVAPSDLKLNHSFFN
jgi:hypothetical protein